MTLGFTGTSHGMTQRQKETVQTLFRALGVDELHHGCEPHADMEAYAIALGVNPNVRIIGHPGLSIRYPPSAPQHRDTRGFSEMRAAHGYLIRNGHIAEEGVDGLVAAPRED